MLFQVEMDVAIPLDFPAEQSDRLKAEERAVSQALQQSGQWRHLWRVAGQYSNVSIFDVESNDALHAILMSLPLFAFMTMRIKPLCRHPSSVRDDDR